MSVVDASRRADGGGRRAEGGGLAGWAHGTHGRIFDRRERRERRSEGVGLAAKRRKGRKIGRNLRSLQASDRLL